MTVQEYKDICNVIVSGSHDADDPKRLPDDRHRCYWHGFGEGVAMAMEKLSDYVEGERQRSHRYYLLLRPVGIGTQPQGMTDWHNFDSRKYIPEIDHEAWGRVEHDHPRTQEEGVAYDMTEANQ